MLSVTQSCIDYLEANLYTERAKQDEEYATALTLMFNLLQQQTAFLAEMDTAKQACEHKMKEYEGVDDINEAMWLGASFAFHKASTQLASLIAGYNVDVANDN